MKYFIFLILILTASFSFAEEKKDFKDNKIDSIIEKIKKSYNDVEILEADFEQTFYHKAYKRKKKSFGSVVFTKDLKMKWSYKNPEEKYIISNGITLWIYEPENEQAFKTLVKDTKLQDATKFLLGKTEVLKDYNITLKNKNELILKPKKESSYKVIYLTFNDDYKIIKTNMIDNFDNENIIVYKDIKINNFKPSKSFFDFIPPKGVEIIKKDN